MSLETPKGVAVVTRAVIDDEPCFSLREENRLSEDSKEMGRYQILRVVRNDRLVTAAIYLGPSSQFTAEPFYLVGGLIDDEGKGEADHTVAELQEMADEIRARPNVQITEGQDLQAGYINHVEERIKQQKHHSTFGSHTQLVRN